MRHVSTVVRLNIKTYFRAVKKNAKTNSSMGMAKGECMFTVGMLVLLLLFALLVRFLMTMQMVQVDADYKVAAPLELYFPDVAVGTLGFAPCVDGDGSAVDVVRLKASESVGCFLPAAVSGTSGSEKNEKKRDCTAKCYTQAEADSAMPAQVSSSDGSWSQDGEDPDALRMLVLFSDAGSAESPGFVNFTIITSGKAVNKASINVTGFAAMQHAVSSALTSHWLREHNITFQTKLQELPQGVHMKGKDFSSLDTIFPAFIMYSILVFAFGNMNLLMLLVQEKKAQLREMLLMAGVSKFVHQLCHIAFFQIKGLFAIIGFTAIAAYVAPHCSYVLLFLVSFVLNLNIQALVFVFQCLLNDPDSASKIGLNLVLLLAAPGIIAAYGYTATTGPGWAILGPSCFSNCLLCIFHAELRVLPGETTGLNWQTWMDPSYGRGGFSFGFFFFFMIADFFIYMVLAWYLNNVVPSDFGSTQPLLFFLSPNYWCPGRCTSSEGERSRAGSRSRRNSAIRTISAEDNTPNADLMEDDGFGVELKDLVKEYPRPSGDVATGPFRAVDGLTVNFAFDSITILLGHNGAGKSTAISMLTGLTSPSGGDAYVGGFSVRHSMGQVREHLGVCMQHDSLWPKLTVREHIVLFSQLRGTDEAEVDNIIQAVGLSEKAYTNSEDLSGGMKRKLSMANAMAGDPAVLILDEPTAGMDPASRRDIWRYLESKKAGRCIIMTTHFMDEAELLGDHVAIMTAGRLNCEGSPLHLRQQFGRGYKLFLTKSSSWANDTEVQAIMAKHAVEATVDSENNAELVLMLPASSSAKFADILDDLEAAKDGLGILSYSLSLVSLEDVFIQLADIEDEKHAADDIQLHEKPTATASTGLTSMIENRYDPGATNAFGLTTPISFSKQFKIGVQMRIREARIRWQSVLSTTLQVTLALIFSILYPMILSNIGPVSAAGNQSTFLTGPVSIDSATAVTFATIPESEANDVTDFLTCFKRREEAQGLVVTRDATSTSADAVYKSIVPKTNNLAAMFIERTEEAATNSTRFGITIAQNMSSPQQAWGLSRVLAAVDAGVFSSLTRDCSASFGVSQEARNGPEKSSLADSSASAMGSIFVMSGILIFVRGTLQECLTENESGFKSQQIISGASVNSYWCSLQMVYILKFIPIVMLFFAICAAIPYPNFQSIVADYGWAKTGLIMILGTNALLPSAFWWSVDRGQVATTSASYYSFFIFGVSIAAFLVCGLVVIFLPKGLWTIAVVACTIVSPLLGIILGLMPILGLDFFQPCVIALLVSAVLWIAGLIRKEKSALQRQETPLSPISLSQVITCVVPGAEVGSPVEPGKVIEVKWLGRRIQVAVPVGVKVGDSFQAALPREVLIDEDVKAEEQRVMSAGVTDKIIVKRLAKQYPTKATPALGGLSFGVPEGQCFGLLGPNGAGKTTTAKIIIGEEAPSQGSALVNGFSTATDLEKVYQSLGLCAQFDALSPHLSVRETIHFFGALRGVENIDAVTQHLMNSLNLNIHANKATKTLSGGNRRKTSLAVAMVGSPTAIVLDEPSTGMDPQARHQMWGAMQELLPGRSAILTTHLMAEAEALCARIGIVVNGALACIGTPTHLKSKFGDGLFLEVIFARPEDVERTSAHVRSFAPDMQVLDFYNKRVRYALPMTGQTGSLASVLRQMESKKAELGIVDYDVSQTSLDQIFMQMARAQSNDTPAEPSTDNNPVVDNDLEHIAMDNNPGFQESAASEGPSGIKY